MRVVLTNLSDALYKDSRLRLNESARKFGVKEIRSYDFTDLQATPFYKEHKQILDQPRGRGYWLWKAYIILEAMKELAEGDVVIYSDCGIDVIDSLDPLVKICRDEQPVLLFANGDFMNAYWTKRDAFVLMDCDHQACWFHRHCDAAFALFRKSEPAIRFLQEWLAFCSDARILTDIPNTCGKKNLPGFIEHRWDQSVLSLLAYKFNIPFYRMPTQFGNHYKMPSFQMAGEFNCINQLKQKQVGFYAKKPYYNSPYYQLLNHHRSKNNEKQKAKSSLSVTRAFKKGWRKTAGLVNYWYYTYLAR